jgi:hypothetical protein
MMLERERRGLGSTWDAGMGSRAAPIRREKSWSAERIRLIRGSEVWKRADRGPSFKSSPVSLAGIGDDDLRRSCDSFIPRMSVTAASAPHSTIGSGTRWDRAVSFRKGPCGRVRRKPKACITAVPIDSYRSR